MRPREAMRYGDAILSVQASEAHYCSPRVDGLPLEQYRTVEVALWRVDSRRDFCRPSDLGIEGQDALFTDDHGVAAYFPWPDLQRLIAALEVRAQRQQPSRMDKQEVPA